MQVFTTATTITEFGPRFNPVGHVALGERFAVETVDCYGGQITNERTLRSTIDRGVINQATGPISVVSVASQDWVEVKIDHILLSGHGFMATSPGIGVLGDKVTSESTRVLKIHHGKAWLTSNIGVLLRPMVGVLGVATAGETVPTSIPGNHGGNLDTKLIEPGASLVIRANQPELGLAIGDLHGAMGDGEVSGTGIEIAGRVHLRVLPFHRSQGRLPLIINRMGIHIIASGQTLDGAIREATLEAVSLMRMWHDLSWHDAYRLTSAVGDTQISQIVNPLKTVRVAIPGEWCGPHLPSQS